MSRRPWYKFWLGSADCRKLGREKDMVSQTTTFLIALGTLELEPLPRFEFFYWSRALPLEISYH